nr:putative reverse transcriptase domain-containing protein [Tanacetum cinerariifolium]
MFSILVLVAPEVGAAVVALPAKVLELDTHSSLEADPLESSSPLVFVAPMVSHFLCLDDSESDTEIPERHVSPTPHDAMLTRWRSKVALRSSLPTTSILEILTAPILPAPSVIVAPSFEFPLALVKLTVRKSVIPLPSHRLALSEAYLRWRSASLSTIYSPTTSESSAGDSSSDSSNGPSHKRCRSSAATVISSIYATRALVPSRADLLPPCKRFRYSISPEDSVEEDIDTDMLEDIEADTIAVEVTVDIDVEAVIDAGIDMEVDVRIDVEDEIEDEVESSDKGTMKVGVDVVAKIDIPNGMLMPDAEEHLEQAEEEDIETGQRELEARSLIAGGERASLLKQDANKETGYIRCEAFRFSSMMLCMYFRLTVEPVNMTITRSGMTPEVIKELINRRVEEALATYEATRAANVHEAENQSQNGSNGDNGNGGNRNGENGNGGNENPNENNRDARPVARKCTYQDFIKCQPLNFKGTKKVVRFQELTMMCTKMVPEEEDQFEKFIGGAYTDGNNNRELYNGPLPLYNKCKLHHEGPCTMRCEKCNKLKDQNRRNKARNKNGVGEARGKEYVLGRGDANLDSNVVKGTFLLNNYYAFVFFDSGADRSFVSTTFSTFLGITPDTLDVSYDVKIVDEKVSKTNTTLKGCTLGLLGHPFNIDLMPVELGSFDIIIGMDWLANHHAVTICDVKIVRIPYGDEVLIVQGNRGGKDKKSKLSIILCTKTQNYVKRGCLIFLAKVMKKENKNKSVEKRLKDVLTVREFLEVFPEDFPGLLPTRQVEFQIDLVLGAAPVVRTPYRLASSELQELSTQLQELSNKGFIRPSSSPPGKPRLVCQKERWIFSDVYRLLRAKKANYEESVSTFENQ